MGLALLGDGQDITGMDDIARESIGRFQGAYIDAVIEADAVEIVAALDSVCASRGRGSGRGVAWGGGSVARLGVGGLLLVCVRVVVARLCGRDADVVVVGALVCALFGLAVWVCAVAVTIGIGVGISASLIAALAGDGSASEDASEGGRGDGRNFHDETMTSVISGI